MEKQIVDVDILTANYNNANYIGQLIESVIHSTVWPTQFIIVDDGSTDNSVSVISQYAQQYNFIVPIFLTCNVGFANALNEGLKHVQSSYILRVDADDYIDLQRIEMQFKYLQQHPLVDVLGSNIAYFESQSNNKLFESHVNTNSVAIKKDFLNGSCGVIHGSTISRTSVMCQFLYRQESVPAEDYEIFSKILKKGYIIHNIPQILTYVRVHSNSVSNFLPFSTIKKTYHLASEIWEKKYSQWAIYRQYLHLKHYRLFLFEQKALKRIIYLMISVLFSPSKILKRLLK